MRQQHSSIFVLLVLVYYFHSLNATTCEEKKTSSLTLDFVKQSINDAKSFYPKCNDERDESNCTAKDTSLAHLNVALKLLSVANETCNTCPNVTECPDPNVTECPGTNVTECPDPNVVLLALRPTDCSDVQSQGFNKSGVYEIWPRRGNFQANVSIEVFCDMETDGGGWTVIQRRGKFPNQTDFYQDWAAYKKGFGNLQQEFWLGNENIFILSNQGAYSARFDLVNNTRAYKYAVYDSFSIGDENSQYLLKIHHHSGNAPDDMEGHDRNVFSTKDRLNDNKKNTNCAIVQKAGFWFASGVSYGFGCGWVNLNGLYKPGVTSATSNFWHYLDQGLSSSEIKIRRTYA